MGQASLAAGPDRLPWLTDDKPSGPPPRRSARRDRIAVAGAAIAAVAGLSFWLGAHTWEVDQSPSGSGQRSTTVALPPAVPAPAPLPLQVEPDRIPDVAPIIQSTVEPTPQREVHIDRPARVSTPRLEPTSEISRPRLTPQPSIAHPAPTAVRPVAHSGPLTVWPARVSAGTYGRLVQIGAFGTRLQAKRGWAAMVRAYPGVSRLPAVVVGASNSRGRAFYRFQIGTTSQAHSEVLCQRMEKIHLSCAVVGLPWKPRGVER